MLHALPPLLLALAATPAAAPVALQLRWELEEDVFRDASGSSRAVFTLTNADATLLPAKGWAIYFNALHQPRPGSTKGGLAIEDLAGDFQRIVPGPGFSGLPPGQSIRIEYLTGLLSNVSFAPTGPYIVFDHAPDKGHPLADYRALPFERGPGTTRPRIVGPQAQFALDEAVRDIPLEALPPVFPTPISVVARAGELHLNALPRVVAGAELRGEAAFAVEILRPYLAESDGAGPVTLRLETGTVEKQDSPEAYELLVDPTEGIRIRGRTPAGVFYGLQSLRSLLPAAPSGGRVTLKARRIVDAPRFGYRGLMLDVARNFQPKAMVLRTLDLMARYKLNAFHFHLTEDEGWRLEIPSLPELTSVGARRGHTVDGAASLPPAYGSGPEVDGAHGSGFYSRADYMEILRYAAARHIEVIPELEMPGHARAAIKAMEARASKLRQAGDEEGAKRFLLSDPEDRSSYSSPQRYHDNVMNPALPSTYSFIEQVVRDVAAMHREAGVPLRNLHMGGDEVPPGVWERSPAAQATMKERGLGPLDLWFVFYGRVEQILKGQGLVTSGWEEIGVRKETVAGRDTLVANPGFANRGWRTYVWNNVPGWGNEDLAYRLANGGYKVVLCPVTHMYFDLAVNPNPEEPGLDWGGHVSLREPFELSPFDLYRSVRKDREGNPLDPGVFAGKERLTERGRSNILGLQANLWSETLGGDGRLDYMLVPKIFGLAERAWAPEPEWAREGDEQRSAALFREAWSEFVGVVGKRELPRLTREVQDLRYRIPTPGLKLVDGRVLTSLELPGFVLRYTVDGSEPGPTSPEVRGPLPAGGPLRVAAFDTRGRKGHTATLVAR